MTSKVESTTTSSAAPTIDSKPTATGEDADDSIAGASVQPGGLMGDISSPHELTDWVDNVIDKLENRFGAMREQVDERMTEMSARIDALENSIQDVISGNIAHYSQTSSGTPSSTATSTQQHKDGSDEA